MGKTELTNGSTFSDYKPYYRRSKWYKVVRKLQNVILDNLLLFTTILGVGIGFIIGLAVREANPSESALMWLGKEAYFIYICFLFLVK